MTCSVPPPHLIDITCHLLAVQGRHDLAAQAVVRFTILYQQPVCRSSPVTGAGLVRRMQGRPSFRQG